MSFIFSSLSSKSDGPSQGFNTKRILAVIDSLFKVSSRVSLISISSAKDKQHSPMSLQTWYKIATSACQFQLSQDLQTVLFPDMTSLEFDLRTDVSRMNNNILTSVSHCLYFLLLLLLMNSSTLSNVFCLRDMRGLLVLDKKFSVVHSRLQQFLIHSICIIFWQQGLPHCVTSIKSDVILSNQI